MSKREKFIWILGGLVLIWLFFLSSTDLIIKEKKTDIYPVSIVIDDTSDDYYGSFKKGVDKAAIEYNVDISFITLYQKEDAIHQLDLVKREMDDGAGAVILAPALPAQCAKQLDEMILNGSLIVLGNMFPSDHVKAGLSVDYYEAGKKLASAIVRDSEADIPIYLFTEGLDYQYNSELYDGLLSVLKESHFHPILFEKKSEDTFRRVIEETVYPGSGNAMLVALDAPSLLAAADIIGGSPVYGKYISGLYGFGTTTKILNYLDTEVIRGLVVSNRFDEGYLSVQKAVEAINKEGQREQIVLDTYYIEKKDLRDSRFEKMLYPID